MQRATERCEFDRDELLVREEILLQASVSEIAPVIDRIMRIVKQAGCAEGHEADIELSLFEALANAVRHGCDNDPSKVIQCCIACDEERGMLIVVRDPGPGFDPKSIPSPITAQNLYSQKGRGIYLINQLMDEVRFEKGGTEIHMIKRPPGTTRAILTP